MKLHDENAPWRRLLKDELLNQWPDDIYLVDVEHIEHCGLDMSRCIVVCDKLETKDSILLVQALGVRHVVQVSNPKLASAIEIAASMIANPAQFTQDASNFAFNTMHAPFESVSFSFTSSKQKDAILRKVSEHLETFIKNRQVIVSVHLIADELFTNAMFNAPVDAKGKFKNAQLRRTSAVDLDPGLTARLIITHNEQTLFVACEDPFGSLRLSSVVNKVADCANRGVANAINFGEGGSGIGCYMMIEQSSSFVMSVEPGKRTVVGCFVPYSFPLKIRDNLPKNFHLAVPL